MTQKLAAEAADKASAGEGSRDGREQIAEEIKYAVPTMITKFATDAIVSAKKENRRSKLHRARADFDKNIEVIRQAGLPDEVVMAVGGAIASAFRLGGLMDEKTGKMREAKALARLEEEQQIRDTVVEAVTAANGNTRGLSEAIAEDLAAKGIKRTGRAIRSRLKSEYL